MKKLFILLTTGLLTVGCSDYFDKKGDDNTIPASRFYGDEGAFLSALTDIYTQLRAETLYGGTLNMTMMNFLSHEFQPRSATEKAAYDRNYSNTALKEQLRSEEHTSELQSRQYLVCRLLLEKKKKNS